MSCWTIQSLNDAYRLELGFFRFCHFDLFHGDLHVSKVVAEPTMIGSDRKRKTGLYEEQCKVRVDVLEP